MEPKFQSSFIPKGTAAPTAKLSPVGPGRKQSKSLLSLLSTAIFTISILLAAGAFGYKFYLRYSIDRMETDLRAAQETLRPELVEELTRVSNRMASARELVSSHEILTPLFIYLEEFTSRLVRFSNFTYTVTDRGPEITMRGEARGYSALAFQADVFNRNPHFRDSVFSDLALNDRGDVIFLFQTRIDPEMISYRNEVNQLTPPAPVVEATPPTGTSTATTTSALPVATSTQPN